MNIKHNETKEWLELEKRKIEQWEKEQEKEYIWDKIGQLPFTLLDKMTPSVISEKINKIIDEISFYIEEGGKYLVDEKTVLTEFQTIIEQPINQIEDISNLPLIIMDSVSFSLINKSKNIATIQGATTGVGGLITLSADIPIIFALNIKILQEVAMSYGYNIRDPKERLYIIKILQLAYANSGTRKKILLEEIHQLEQTGINDILPSQIQAWRDVLFSYREKFEYKKILQSIPILGIIFGAYSNRKNIEEVAFVGKMLYRKRRINEKLTMSSKKESSMKKIKNIIPLFKL